MTTQRVIPHDEGDPTRTVVDQKSSSSDAGAYRTQLPTITDGDACPHDPDGEHSSDCGCDYEQGRDVSALHNRAATDAELVYVEGVGTCLPCGPSAP